MSKKVTPFVKGSIVVKDHYEFYVDTLGNRPDRHQYEIVSLSKKNGLAHIRGYTQILEWYPIDKLRLKP